MEHRPESTELRLILERGERARLNGQRGRAVRLFRQALAMDRSSVEVHQKLAPLLAAEGQSFDAWQSYRAVAHAALRAGRDDRAVAVYREASQTLPREIQAWQGLARLLVRQREDAAAVEALVEGSRQFRSHWNRPEAIHLLRRARAIAPWHFEVVVELARLLTRAQQRDEAQLLLDELSPRCESHQLPRLRAARLAVSPGPRSLLRWLAGLLWEPGTREAPETAGAEAPAADTLDSLFGDPAPADEARTVPQLRAVEGLEISAEAAAAREAG